MRYMKRSAMALMAVVAAVPLLGGCSSSDRSDSDQYDDRSVPARYRYDPDYNDRSDGSSRTYDERKRARANEDSDGTVRSYEERKAARRMDRY